MYHGHHSPSSLVILLATCALSTIAAESMMAAPFGKAVEYPTLVQNPNVQQARQADFRSGQIQDQSRQLGVEKRFNEFVGKRSALDLQDDWEGDSAEDQEDSGTLERVNPSIDSSKTSSHLLHDTPKARLGFYIPVTSATPAEMKNRILEATLQAKLYAKRQYDFVGKRSYDFLGRKRNYGFLGKKRYDFLGKKNYDFLGKKNYDFLGKKNYDFLGKKNYGFLRKNQFRSNIKDNINDNSLAMKPSTWVAKSIVPVNLEPSSLRSNIIDEEGMARPRRYAEFLGKRDAEMSDRVRLAALLRNSELRKRLSALLTQPHEGGRTVPEFVG